MRPIDQAIALHQAGRIAEAEALYRKVLAQHGRDFDALHMLGIVCAQKQQFDEAERLLRKAISVDGKVPPCLVNYGNVLSQLKRYGEAVEIYQKALTLAPNHAPIHSDVGNAQKELGRLDAALASYDQAVALQPNFPIAHYNRGIVLERLDRHAEALASYERALSMVPNYAAAHCNRGGVLEVMGRTAEALQAYERAVALDPNLALAHCHRGALLSIMGRLEDGLRACERAVALDPKLAIAHANHAAALAEVHRHQEVVAAADKALALDPTVKYVEGLRLHAKMQQCDWSDYDAQIPHLVADAREQRSVQLPFIMLSISSSAADQRPCAEHYCRGNFATLPPPLWNGEAHAHDRVRVAYLSADLQEHAVSYLMAGVFEQHDRSRFETFGFSYGVAAGNSLMRERIKRSLEHFVDVQPTSAPDIARMLRAQEIDIVVDLMGHTKGSRPAILAMRPAPVQVSYLGYPGTTGAPWIDYILADRHVIPKQLEAGYSEQVVALPDTFQANDAKRPRPQGAPSRAALGLPDDAFVFCSFSNSYKFTPAVFDVWMHLLGKVDRSVLWILAPNAVAEQNLRSHAQARGIDPKRIVTAPLVPYVDYLARYRRADLFLDTLPFNAGTTASDALWCGLPVVTCWGEAFASRMAGSLLHAAGLPELVTASLDEYEALALRLAQDPAALASVKAKLADHTSSLFDTARFTRHLEAAFTTMCDRARRGLKPESFAVEPIAAG